MNLTWWELALLYLFGILGLTLGPWLSYRWYVRTTERDIEKFKEELKKDLEKYKLEKEKTT